MNVNDSITILKQMLEKYPKDGSNLFFSRREALKTAIQVMEKTSNKTTK